MNRLRRFAYGIVLGSVVWSVFSQLYRHTTMAATAEGILILVANGEYFVRQDFVSKDGWEIEFDRLDVNLSDATAYSTEFFEPQPGDTKKSVKYEHRAQFDTAGAVDLAAGEADAEPITVSRAEVPLGFYNALSWGLSTAKPNSAIAGNTMVLEGRANKNGMLELNQTDLAEQLSPQNYRKLTEASAGLGHVGEGHCVITNSQ